MKNDLEIPLDVREGFVKLNNLCRPCGSICSIVKSPAAAAELLGVRDRPQIFKHYQTSHDLESSAGNGCHLCSLLLDVVEPYIAILETLQVSQEKESSYAIQ